MSFSVETERLFSDAAVAGGRRLPRDRIASLAEGSLRQWRAIDRAAWHARRKAEEAR